MFYTLEGAARRTGLGEFTILRAIEEGRIAAIKDLFGDWQVHELELRALKLAPDGNADQDPGDGGGTSAAQHLHGDGLEIFAPGGSDFDSKQLPSDSVTEGRQAAHGSTELVPSIIFLPGIAAQNEQCPASGRLLDRPHQPGTTPAPKLQASARSTSACKDEIRLNEDDKISGEPPHRAPLDFGKLPIRGILLFVAGWIVGLGSYHLFSTGFTGSKRSIAAAKPIPEAVVRQPSIADAPRTKPATAPKSNAAAAHPPQRRTTVKPMLDQERDTTGSIKQQDRMLQDRAVTPFPDTRPTTVTGWTLKSVSDGIAILEGPYGTWKAARGDLVPGLGKVDSIVLWGNRWIVATTRGLVTTP
jgi:hypothetical protein